METIRFTGDELHDIESATEREYLETNGLGGYASGTITGIRTRKYHGLLVASLTPPTGRQLLVADLEEAVKIGTKRYEISTHQYLDVIHPHGYRFLKEFRLDPFPTFVFDIEGLILEKTIFMCHGENATCVIYSLKHLPKKVSQGQVLLEVRPLLAMRTHHDLIRAYQDHQMNFDAHPTWVTFHNPKGLVLTISFLKGRFEFQPLWYRNFYYRNEDESGYEATEDLFSPGRLVFTFEYTRDAKIGLSADDKPIDDFESRSEAEEKRRKRWENLDFKDNFLSRLLLASDAFIVSRQPNGKSIIAGYPWFTDWGRDAMISLPGLCLVTRRFSEARQIISTFVRNMKDGLIPNRFEEGAEEPLYNTIDATLWMFEAAWKYYEFSGDGDFIFEILPQLRNSISHHIEGTHFGIHVDEDGLLMGGCEGVQLTWMDAKVGDKVITARIGKPVEINALWYNALRIMAKFASDFGGLAEESKYEDLALCAREAFNEVFWNAESGYLFDNISPSGPDPSLRPNQIFAISLSHPVLRPERWRRVVDVVGDHLLTPYGLRTLAPEDPNYKGHYRGDLFARDHAYHQGTVWPWLLGHYLIAYVRAYGYSSKTVDYVRRQLGAFNEHLRQAGLGTISEIFDGDPPHRPNGCIAQAWSIAELLRAAIEIIHSSELPNLAESVGR